jgi:hypothetical protein
VTALVEERLAPPDVHRPPVTLLCVENTHNRAGGTVTCSATSCHGLRFVVHGQIGDLEVERLAGAMAEAMERPGSP